MKQTNRGAMAIMFLTMFIVMVGFGVIMPILPFYAEKMGATATHLGLLFASYSMVQFLFSPVWGRASDRVGRKPIILIGLIGFSVSFFLFGLATKIWMLFAARLLGGLLSAATLPTVMAYIADTTSEKERGNGMGVLGAAMGMGITFGPVLGGFLGEYSPSMPFFVSASLALAVAIFAWIFLPETRSKQDQAASRQTARRGIGLDEIWAAFVGPLGFIMILAFLASFASANLEGTFALFSEVQLGFGEAQMGTVFGMMGVTMALTQGFLVGPFINRWGEERMIQVGLVSSAIGFIALLFTFNMVSIVAVMSLMGLGNAAMRPAINTLVSKRTAADQQGSMLGVVNSYNSLGRIFGPIVGGVLFDLLGFQSPYIFGAAVFVITWSFSIYVLRQQKLKDNSTSDLKVEVASMD